MPQQQHKQTIKYSEQKLQEKHRLIGDYGSKELNIKLHPQLDKL